MSIDIEFGKNVVLIRFVYNDVMLCIIFLKIKNIIIIMVFFVFIVLLIEVL